MKAIALTALALCAAQSSQAAGLVALLGSTPGTQSLNFLDSSAPAGLSPVAVSGLEVDESLLAIDFRPLNGQLFGLGSASNLYTLNTTTGVATRVGINGITSITLAAGIYGFDFNPTIDRIRIVGNNDSNSVGNPDSGDATAAIAVFYDTGDVNFGANPNLVHHAYNNNFVPTASSQLYALDSTLNILATQANSAGTLGTVGALGVNFDEAGGFDIGADGTAFAALSVGGSSNLHTINLATGQATPLGVMSGNVTGLTVVPEPSSALLLGCGALALFRRKRSS